MKNIQLVTWAVNNEEYAVEIEHVQEIIRVKNITRMPFSPDYLPGVINLRGRIIPVMDMAKRLSKTQLTLSDSSRIIIVSKDGFTAGMLVEHVSEIFKQDPSLIESRDTFMESNRYIKGIGKTDNRVFMILDLDEIFKIHIKHEV